MSLRNPGQYEHNETQPVCEQVTVSPDPLTGGVPEQFRSAISIDAIHDGNFIPHIFADQIGANLSELTKIFERNATGVRVSWRNILPKPSISRELFSSQ